MMVYFTSCREIPPLLATCGCIHLVVDEAPVAKGNQQVGDVLHCEHGN